MPEIFVQGVTRPNDNYVDWLLYEYGRYSRPVAILSSHEMHRAVRAYAALDPDGAQKAVNEGKADRDK